MLLNEMFSPLGGPKDEGAEVDWIDDLKFFIDNDEHALRSHIFPAVMKHQLNIKNPDAYKLYVNPIIECAKDYCKKFNIDKPKEKFPPEEILNLAKQIANEQETHIKHGDYKK